MKQNEVDEANEKPLRDAMLELAKRLTWEGYQPLGDKLMEMRQLVSDKPLKLVDPEPESDE